MKINNLRIGTRLNLGFSVILALLVTVTVLAGWQASKLWAVAENYSVQLMPQTAAVFDFSGAIRDLRRYESQYVLWAPNAKEIKLTPPITESIVMGTSQARKALLDCHRLALNTAADTRCTDLSNLLDTYLAAQAKVVASVKPSETNPDTLLAAKNLIWLGASYSSFKQLNVGFNDWKAETQKLSDQAVTDANDTYRKSRLWQAVCACCALIIGFVIAFVIKRSIVAPIQISLDIANAVAAGDLRSTITVDSKDELAQLLMALKVMQTKLAEVVGDVHRNADGVASASAQVAQGNADLSTRTEQQAASLEETAASMTQLTEVVRQNADNANMASKLAASASSMATMGGDDVGKMIGTIQRISQGSGKISEITALIEGIAFQTNILALNAAVEAARAGEQGKGFAVVASEVRSLAQRSAAAAKEIKELISTSVVMIDQGSTEAVAVGKTMEGIKLAVHQVSGVVVEIANASHEQRQGIEQVNQAVNQMDSMTQQNAALVEEATAAAQSLEHQAAALKTAVAVFQL